MQSILTRQRTLIGASVAFVAASFSVLSARRSAQLASTTAGGRIVSPERSGGGI